jgi:hypothetical protein
MTDGSDEQNPVRFLLAFLCDIDNHGLDASGVNQQMPV